MSQMKLKKKFQNADEIRSSHAVENEHRNEKRESIQKELITSYVFGFVLIFCVCVASSTMNYIGR